MKVSMKFGSLTSATTPGGSGNGGASSSSGEGGGASNLESVSTFNEMNDPSMIYLYKKEHLGRYINEMKAEIVEGELPSGYDNKNTFYFIQDVEEEEG